MIKTINKISDFLEIISLRISQIFCSLMFILIFALVVSRYIFKYSFPWAEELTRYLMIWMALLTSAVVLRRNQHIRVDIFSHKIPAKLYFLFKTALNLLIIVFIIVLFKEGLSTSFSMRQVSTSSLYISMFWPYFSIPVSSMCMIIFMINNILHDILQMIRS
jgi:TRAP-type C4-dicarboxylate transport system permease small subunit